MAISSASSARWRSVPLLLGPHAWLALACHTLCTSCALLLSLAARPLNMRIIYTRNPAHARHFLGKGVLSGAYGKGDVMRDQCACP